MGEDESRAAIAEVFGAVRQRARNKPALPVYLFEK